MSRHRGAELRRRYGLLGGTSLFIILWLANRLYLHPVVLWAFAPKSAGDGVLAYILFDMDIRSDHNKWSSRYGVKEFVF